MTFKKMMSRLIYLVLACSAMLTLVTCNIQGNTSSLPYYSKQAYAKTKKNIAKNKVVPISSFSFVNQIGDTIDKSFIESSVSVMNFFFTSCGTICPKMTLNLKKIQQAFKNDTQVKMVSFSCDPEKDVVSQLYAYADLYAIDSSKWSLLTGDKNKLYDYAKNQLQLTAVKGREGEDAFIHSPYFVLVDKNSYIRGYYNGTKDKDLAQLINDIKTLL